MPRFGESRGDVVEVVVGVAEHGHLAPRDAGAGVIAHGLAKEVRQSPPVGCHGEFGRWPVEEDVDGLWLVRRW